MKGKYEKGRETMTKNARKLKGFTLIELIVVISIIGVLAAILIPTMTGYIKKAKVASAIESAKTIKMSVENSLTSRYGGSFEDDGELGDALNKILYLDQKSDKTKREVEIVGAFTNKSWYMYKSNNKNGGKSQKVDTVIAGGLDKTFNEKWEKGTGNNPLSYGSKGTCRQYLKDNKTNVGLVIVYDIDCSVRLLQIYRKGILVTYVNGEYIANTNKNARFVGTNVWSSIYSDAGTSTNDELYKISLSDKQIRDDGKEGGWYS